MAPQDEYVRQRERALEIIASLERRMAKAGIAPAVALPVLAEIGIKGLIQLDATQCAIQGKPLDFSRAQMVMNTFFGMYVNAYTASIVPNGAPGADGPRS